MSEQESSRGNLLSPKEKYWELMKTLHPDKEMSSGDKSLVDELTGVVKHIGEVWSDVKSNDPSISEKGKRNLDDLYRQWVKGVGNKEKREISPDNTDIMVDLMEEAERLYQTLPNTKDKQEKVKGKMHRFYCDLCDKRGIPFSSQLWTDFVLEMNWITEEQHRDLSSLNRFRS